MNDPSELTIWIASASPFYVNNGSATRFCSLPHFHDLASLHPEDVRDALIRQIGLLVVESHQHLHTHTMNNQPITLHSLNFSKQERRYGRRMTLRPQIRKLYRPMNRKDKKKCWDPNCHRMHWDQQCIGPPL